MEQDDQPQNIYDDPQFFAGYSQTEHFQSDDWGRAMENRSFVELLGDVSGRHVLDLGCGAGQLAFCLADAGAAEVLGIDPSERMLDVARAKWAHPRVSYRRGSMEEADFSPGAFDLVVSSLALPYVRDYTGLVDRIAQWLAPGGLLVFWTEHPIFTARVSEEGWVTGPEGTRIELGWVTGPDGTHIAWALDHYAEEGLREHCWFVPGVRRYHRMLSTLLNGLIDAGLVIERLLEPTPSDVWLRDRPQDADERRRPMSLLVRARKP